MVATSDEWIFQRSGIRERRIADESEATSDLALKAAQQALERANLVPEDVEFIAVGTTTPDMLFPTVGNIVHHRLGCMNVGSVDLLAACAGSVYSLVFGCQLVQTGKYRRGPLPRGPTPPPVRHLTAPRPARAAPAPAAPAAPLGARSRRGHH